MKKTKKILIGLSAFVCIMIGQISLSAIENSVPLYNGRLKAFIYIRRAGDYWESSGSYSGNRGVAYLVLESHVEGEGLRRKTGTNTYVRDGGDYATRRANGNARVYAYNHYNKRVGAVATPIYAP